MNISTAQQPDVATIQPIKPDEAPSKPALDSTKPLPPESLAEFGIGYSLTSTTNATNDEILDRVLGSAYMTHFGMVQPMSLRQLQNEMGISFNIVSSGTTDNNQSGRKPADNTPTLGANYS